MSLGVEEPRRMEGTCRVSFLLLTGLIPCHSGYGVQGCVALGSDGLIPCNSGFGGQDFAVLGSTTGFSPRQWRIAGACRYAEPNLLLTGFRARVQA